MMVVHFNCLSGTDKDHGGLVLKSTALFKTAIGEWHGDDYASRAIRMVPKKKYSWNANSWTQTQLWLQGGWTRTMRLDDVDGWLHVENPWDDAREQAPSNAAARLLIAATERLSP